MIIAIEMAMKAAIVIIIQTIEVKKCYDNRIYFNSTNMFYEY